MSTDDQAVRKMPRLSLRIAAMWAAAAKMPRWLDAPMAAIALVAVVVTLIKNTEALSAWAFANAAASLLFVFRWGVTCERIRLGTSSLSPLVNRAFERFTRGRF